MERRGIWVRLFSWGGGGAVKYEISNAEGDTASYIFLEVLE
jgi:hypothetical protein